MTHQAHYLDPRTLRWTLTNLGRFDTPEECREAVRPWSEGYARQNGGHRPPVRVLPDPQPQRTEP